MRRRTTRSTRTDTLFPSTTLFRSAPWLRLTAAGYDPVIATPRGGEAPIDPASRSEAFISDAGRGFLADPAAVAALAATLTVDSIDPDRSEEHTSELQSLMRISYAVFDLKKQTTYTIIESRTY